MKKASASKGRVQGKAKAKRSAKTKARPKAKTRLAAKTKAEPKVGAKAKKKATPEPKAKSAPKRSRKTSARVAKKKASVKPRAPAKARARKDRDAPPESTEKPRPVSNGAAHPIDVAATAYDTDVLTVLVREAETDDRREAEEKIRKHLAERKLGEFDPGRINQLRALKAAVVDEIRRTTDSSYFVGTHGLYANPEDFDHKRLAQDFAERFPSISHEAIVGFIPFAIYCYYLR